MQKLQSDQISYLKNGNRPALETVRFIVAQIKNREIEKKAPLNDEEIIQVLKKQVKEIKESIVAFEKGQRTDLLTHSQAQLKLVTAYLPPEISDAELEKEVRAIVDEQNKSGLANPKALIGITIGRLKSKADPSRIMKTLRTIESR